MAAAPAYYVTTPIYYVNDVPHIGHMYTTLACDVLARFKRLDGFNVKFLTGTDEHGQKVDKAARAAGLEPKVFTDKVSENFRALARLMNFSNDDFIRTTEERHLRSCQALWRTLLANDQIYLGSYAGWYAVRDEAFYAESELTTTPGGEKLAPSGAPVEWVEEPSYFFRLSRWQEPLLRLYADNPDFVLPRSRLNEVVSFVRGGLQDLSVSRTTFQWGIPVPDDPAHVMYVWLDALTNYITAIGYPDTDTEDFRTFWPADVHMVGKDILRFHAVYWPAFLMAAGLAPPKRVFAHGWWTVEGQKMSKSLGNAIDPLHLIESYGRDQVRYVMLREVPFGNDGDFSHESVVARINGDLANDYGNLVQRVLSMVAKNCGGVVPSPADRTGDDAALLELCHRLITTVRQAMDRQAFHEGLDALWAVIRAANGYVDRQAPWALRKSDPARMGTVLYVLMEAIRHLAIVTQPFMPEAAGRILDQLAVGPAVRDFAHLGQDHALVAGTPVPTPRGVFPRHEVEAAGQGTA
ncbi:MAG: methionine--tRNA ligase [Rhodospirillales bacterium]|nr:MAG: methionine--tRNA ligase [Rhodospirillales bacterium]